MRQYTNEEIQESLNDDKLCITITLALSIVDIEEIRKNLIEKNGIELAKMLTMNLLPEAKAELAEKEIFDNEKGLSALGFAHVAFFLKTVHYANEIDADINEVSDEVYEIRSIVALSLSKFDINEIISLFNTKHHKVLTYYLTVNLNNEGIKKVLEYGLISLDNLITEKGWKEIKWYIDTTTANKKVDADKIVTQSKKNKWWEFWK